MSEREYSILIFLFIIIVIPIIFTRGIVLVVNWHAHKEQVLSSCGDWYGYGYFRDFLILFNKNNMEKNGYYDPMEAKNPYNPMDAKNPFFIISPCCKKNQFRDSLFDKKSKSEYHAGTIKFNGKGMIMKNPMELWAVEKYMKRFFKELEIQERDNNWELMR